MERQTYGEWCSGEALSEAVPYARPWLLSAVGPSAKSGVALKSSDLSVNTGRDGLMLKMALLTKAVLATRSQTADRVEAFVAINRLNDLDGGRAHRAALFYVDVCRHTQAQSHWSGSPARRIPVKIVCCACATCEK
jgi:hypothetical protein